MKNGSYSQKGNLPKSAGFVLNLQAGLMYNICQTVTQVESYLVYISVFTVLTLIILLSGLLFFNRKPLSEFI